MAYTLQSLSNPEKQKTNLTVFTDQKFTLKKKKKKTDLAFNIEILQYILMYTEKASSENGDN